MAYNKEYYESHKEDFKENNNRYREKNKEEINFKQRERYANLSEEEKQKRIIRQRENRAKNRDLTRIQCRIDGVKRRLKKYEEKMFELQMIDTWNSSDYKYSDELSKKIIYYKNKIEELQKEKEKLSGKVQE